MSGSKARFIEFCRTAWVPMQLQPWWLDAVCSGAGSWDVALASDRSGAISGAMPFYLTRRWGVRVVQLPPFTAYAGPWLRETANPGMRTDRRYAFERDVFTGLIDQLPPLAFFHQHFRPEIDNWLPFYWKGFRQTTRYTYLLPGTCDMPAFFAGLKNTLRTELRKAEQGVILCREDDPELIFSMNRQSFARKGLRHPYPFRPFARLHEALAGRGQSVLFVARGRQSGAPLAGLYLAFDRREAAVLLTGLMPAGQHSGALHSLYWEAVRFCAEKRLDLDFEGSMEPGIERVFRAFGGRLTPYFRVWRAGNRLLDLLYR